jgi:hypothetical protein
MVIAEVGGDKTNGISHPIGENVDRKPTNALNDFF